MQPRPSIPLGADDSPPYPTAVPYVVGRWVRGAEHYARQELIAHLLTGHDDAFWVVGSRRMGKTSLLRQIELVASDPDGPWLPLFLDIQGCTVPDDFTQELRLALQDAVERLRQAGVDADVPPAPDAALAGGTDAVDLLRRLGRRLAAQGKRLLLLVDEAEALVDLAQADEAWLARLRKTLFEGHQRTIVASTRLLTQLTDQSVGWKTSPFLFGFRLLHLWPFDRAGAVALIRQTQSEFTITAADHVIDEILAYTNYHPHLIQHLCQRLFVPTGDASGALRPIEEADLLLDPLLAGYFQLDFEHLSDLAKQVLLEVAGANTLTERQLAEIFAAEASPHLRQVLQTMTELGQLRYSGDSWSVGNEFLRRWLFENRHRLATPLTPAHADRLDAANIAQVGAALGVTAAPRALASRPAALTEEEFFATVQSFFREIRHFVEQDDGHKLLVNRVGASLVLRSEEEIQIALKHWLRPMCWAQDIDLNREPLTGRGYLDFKLSIGHRLRCLVEVKLYNSSKLHDGVAIQLPLYLLADRARYGIYVPVFLEPAGCDQAVQALRDLASQRAAVHGVVLDVIDIRAWKPQSASKAEAVESRDRYGVG